jgi:hypothetical protein
MLWGCGSFVIKLFLTFAYTKAVRIPNPLTADALKNREIEVRLEMEDKDNSKGYFIHCFMRARLLGG